MKYGDTLRQRSIPEWGHHNIDYDFLKDLIKDKTTPGAGKAVSIPGQEDVTENAFSGTFFEELKDQHDRINLFIKSKSGEIERRLAYISKQLQSKRLVAGPDGRLPVRTVEKYAKIEADVTKAGEEIQSLSRYCTAQCTGFYKILKKYKRWTKDQYFGHRFKSELLEDSDSFFQLDLGYLLDQYIDVLHAVRAPFDVAPNSKTATDTGKTLSSSAASRISKAIDGASNVDFDIALSTAYFGSRGSKATYWIHPDHVVEVHVLLLQYMRLYGATKSQGTPKESTYSTPSRRKSSITLDVSANFGNEDDTGLMILDDPECFARKQNASTIGDSEEQTGTPHARPAGNVRWASEGEATAIVGIEANPSSDDTETIKMTKVKRKYLPLLLDRSAPLEFTRISDSTSTSHENNSRSEDAPLDSAASVRQWLVDHEGMKPIASIYTKRTRFIGLHNDLSGGLWATLDRDIHMKNSMLNDLKNNDWASEARVDSKRFPHAILEIRREGAQSAELIKVLDRSHLLERIRGFSLEVQAVWTCCKPNAMSAPLWIPVLEKDIRKLPELSKRQRRQASSRTGSSSLTPPQTSTSTTSVTDGQTSPSTIPNYETSATSAPEMLSTPSLKAFRKKRKKSYFQDVPIQAQELPTEQRYWNEYDNPEDAEDSYYIYIDPNDTVKFPGQDTIAKWARQTRKLLYLDKISEHSPLLPVSEQETSDEETGDEAVSRRGYGAIPSKSSSSRHDGEGYFSSIFRSFRDSDGDTQATNPMQQLSERERQDLLNLVEYRQHEREMTKLRFYSTCLVAAVVIDVILTTLTMTSRRKQRGSVDSAVLFGAIANILLIATAILSMRTRREPLGWFHQSLFSLVIAGVIIGDVLLLKWVFVP